MEEDEVQAWQRRAEVLWQLLDDIDTASDMFKDDYEGFAKYTWKKQQERYKILTSDGHRLYLPGEEPPLGPPQVPSNG